MTVAVPARDRVRRHRERRRTGATVLNFIIIGDEVGLAEMLRTARLLGADDDKAAIAAAVGRLLDAMVAQHKEAP